MGEYSVEIRGESFCLRGETIYRHPGSSLPVRLAPASLDEDHPRGRDQKLRARHGIFVYDNGSGQGTAEILIEDIPKIRAALDQVERVAKGSPRPSD
jgi:hypothetical protein